MSQYEAGSSGAVKLCLFFCIAACSTPVLKPDSAQRPNQPMFIDPIEDLKPQSGALADSWFVCSNLTSGDHEFGLLIHYLKGPLSGSPTVAITDVTEGKYILDESGSGKVTATPGLIRGFDRQRPSLVADVGAPCRRRDFRHGCRFLDLAG